jgi:hypothetical protein
MNKAKNRASRQGKAKQLESHPLDQLPFIKTYEKGDPLYEQRLREGKFPRDFWAAEGSESWGDDNERGQQYGELAAAFMLERIDESEGEGIALHLLSHIVYAMIDRQERSGLIVGFFWPIAEYVIQAKRLQAKLAQLEPGQGVVVRKPYPGDSDCKEEARQAEAA